MPDTDSTAADSPHGAGSSTSEQAQVAPRLPTTEEQIQEIHIGGMTPLVGRIQIVSCTSAPSENLLKRTGSTRGTTPMLRPRLSRKSSCEREERMKGEKMLDNTLL
jgi:hypothetical protein